MTLPIDCSRCHQVFAITYPTQVRVVCPDCLAAEKDRPDCPICGNPKGTRKRALLCDTCMLERKRLSSKMNHKAERATHGTEQEHANATLPVDMTLENLRDATLRFGRAVTARPVAEPGTPLAPPPAPAPDNATASLVADNTHSVTASRTDITVDQPTDLGSYDVTPHGSATQEPMTDPARSVTEPGPEVALSWQEFGDPAWVCPRCHHGYDWTHDAMLCYPARPTRGAGDPDVEQTP